MIKSSVISKNGDLMHMLDLEINDHGPNSAYNINLRTGQAKFKRQHQRFEKQCAQLERGCKAAKRRINSEKFLIISLIGHDPFPPDGNCDQILYPNTQPGFCYRSNGQPRKRFNSLVESKTRRIVHDMEGKLGLIPKPAANVVSDNPMMSEVLSSPEIISILCDLRTTAALLKDKVLLEQFKTKFTYLSSMEPNSTMPFLKTFDRHDRKKNEAAVVAALNPIDYLKQYRTNLLQEFFEVLQEKAEIRLSRGISKNNALRYLWAIPNKSVRMLANNERVLDSNKAPISINDWNDALLSSLEDAQEEPFHAKYSDVPSTNFQLATTKGILLTESSVSSAGQSSSSSVRTIRNPLLSSNLGRKSSKPRVRFGGVDIKQLTNVAKNGAGPKTSSKSAVKLNRATSHSSANTLAVQPLTKEEQIRLEHRKEFDAFMKGLIQEIEHVADIEKTYIDIKHKNPSRKIQTHEAFVKLLNKPSLFSTLTEDDLIFYEFEGGKAQVKKLLAEQLDEVHTQSPVTVNDDDQIHHHQHRGHHRHHNIKDQFGGDKNALHPTTIVDSPSDISAKLRQGLASSNLSSRPDTNTTTTSTISESANSTVVGSNNGNSNPSSAEATKDGKSSRGSVLSYNSAQSYINNNKTFNRVCCAACKAKLQQACHVFRERDRKDQMQIQAGFWKAPGRSNEWTQKAPATDITNSIHLLSIPTKVYSKDRLKSSASASKKLASAITSSRITKYIPTKFSTKLRTSFGGPGRELAVRSSTPLFPGSTKLDKASPARSLITKAINDTYGATIMEKAETTLNGFDGGDITEQRKLRKSSNPNSWTLKISKLDIMKLRHEMEIEALAAKLQQISR